MSAPKIAHRFPDAKISSRCLTNEGLPTPASSVEMAGLLEAHNNLHPQTLSIMSERMAKENSEDHEDIFYLNAYRQGDVDALGWLVEKYKRPLFAFLLRFTSSPEEAEEWFQETWVRGIRHMNHFKKGKLLSWLFRIAHNMIIDQSRRRKPIFSLDAPISNGHDSEFQRDGVTDKAVLPDQAVALGDLQARIDAALQKLPIEQREVFLWRMQAQLPFKDIADIQHCSINTALARMQYALDKLRKELAADYREWQEIRS